MRPYIYIYNIYIYIYIYGCNLKQDISSSMATVAPSFKAFIIY